MTRRILDLKARQLRDDPNNLFSDLRRVDFVAAARSIPVAPASTRWSREARSSRR